MYFVFYFTYLLHFSILNTFDVTVVFSAKSYVANTFACFKIIT